MPSASTSPSGHVATFIGFVCIAAAFLRWVIPGNGAQFESLTLVAAIILFSAGLLALVWKSDRQWQVVVGCYAGGLIGLRPDMFGNLPENVSASQLSDLRTTAFIVGGIGFALLVLSLRNIEDDAAGAIGDILGGNRDRDDDEDTSNDDE